MARIGHERPQKEIWMTVSDYADASAQELADTFAGSPTFVSCHDDSGEVRIDLALCPDKPGNGFSSLGTVTLADHDIGYGETRLQIVAVYPASSDGFSRAIGSCALWVVNRGWPLRRGAVHPDVMTLYGLSSTLEHLLYVLPFSWRHGPHPLTVGNGTIEWLQAIPISEAERGYAEANGADALEKLLVENNIDVTDFNRASLA
ncbi:suppressor of fused domain protein [Sphingomonas koreensis]|nr:suppressor of fused domain protein [Sphingomonas koreensis]